MDPRARTPASFARYASGGTWKLAPHLALLNRVLMAAAAGEKWASRVIVQLPPRHGKSEFISAYFPAWYLGMYPDRKFILASYSDHFAAQWGLRARDLLETFGRDVFGVRVRQDARAREQWRILGRRGAMFTAGIGGSLTGRGGHFAVIDDPVKNNKDALSPTIRETAKDFYRSTLRTRMERADAPIVVVMTRWHEDDLAGWLQKEHPADWLVINLPAIAEVDEELTLPGGYTWTRPAGAPLWPEKFTLDDLQGIAKDLGGLDAYWFTAMYQQRPTPLGGGILKPELFRRYARVGGGYLLDAPAGPRLLSADTLPRFATMDLATTTKTVSDWSVVGIFGIDSPNLLVLDWLRWKSEGPDLPRVAAGVYEAYKPAYLGVESVGFQMSTVQDMRRGMPSEGRPPLPIKELRPDGDKTARALTLAARMGGGHVYVPERAPWLPALESEMALFPRGDHDDQVDALSYAAKELTEYGEDFLHSR